MNRPEELNSTFAVLLIALGGISVSLIAQDCDPTLPNIEGPFYRTGAPERTDLYVASEGRQLMITGTVVGYDCRPIEGAWLDFWHADSSGIYDNTSPSYAFRGQQFADDEGRYELVTNVPGEYPGRPKHLHVKVQGEVVDELTTQLYFPDDPLNDSDPWHDIELELVIELDLPDRLLVASYTFQIDEPGTGYCPGDFNEDRRIDGEDLTTLLANWGTDNPLVDLDEDGLVGGADLSALLGFWGSCFD